MKERPILFSAPMVLAILSGSKTQTRRVVKVRDKDLHGDTDFLHGGSAEVALGHGSGSICEFRKQDGQWFGLTGYNTVCNIDCPYGQPGDRLWVRETFQVTSNYHADCRDQQPPFDDGRPIFRDNDPAYPYWEQCHYAATDRCPELISVQTDEIEQRWRPSIHMPRWASRITLEIVSVRVERLQDITEADCMAEGIKRTPVGNLTTFEIPGTPIEHLHPKVAYEKLWESINGKGSWDANPWVWVVGFKRIGAEVVK